MANHRLTAVMTLAGIMGSNSPWIAAIVAVVFTTLARFVKGVSRSGAVAGAVICFALIASAGLGAFVALISVFALTWIATRFGYRRKQTLGIAERPEGRKASQVSATLEWPRLVQSSTRSHTAIRCSCLQWLPPLRKPVQTLFRVNLGRLRTASRA